MSIRAIVRPPGRRYADALTRDVPAAPVDLGLALSQHRAYVAALVACGVDVTELPGDDDHPDAVFVQDPVLVLGGRAIVLRSAAPSRRGEAFPLVEALKRLMPVAELAPPATLDGGDILVTDDGVFVGLSTRSNEEGCRQLQGLAGRPVTRVPLPTGLLHLLSGCTWLGGSALLTVPSLAPAFPRFDAIIVPEDEASAANVLVVGSHVIVPAGYPAVAGLLEARGFAVHAVPCSEFEKRDGGVTCRALLF